MARRPSSAVAAAARRRLRPSVRATKFAAMRIALMAMALSLAGLDAVPPAIAAEPTVLPPPLPRARQGAPAPAAPSDRAPPAAPSAAPSLAPSIPGPGGAPPPAAPAAAAAPAFDDWRQGCERRPNQEKPVCFIEQRLSHVDTPDRLAVAMALGYFAPGSKLAMIVKLPPTVIQEAGMIVQIDDNEVREVGIRACGPANCTVAALVDDKLLRELRAGKRATVAYSLKETEEIVRVPLSLKGLTRGLASLRPAR